MKKKIKMVRLTKRWKPMTKKEKKKFDKVIEEHRKEMEKRTGMTYEDWQQTIGNNIE